MVDPICAGVKRSGHVCVLRGLLESLRVSHSSRDNPSTVGSFLSSPWVAEAEDPGGLPGKHSLIVSFQSLCGASSIDLTSPPCHVTSRVTQILSAHTLPQQTGASVLASKIPLSKPNQTQYDQERLEFIPQVGDGRRNTSSKGPTWCP